MKRYYIASTAHTCKGDTAIALFGSPGAGLTWDRDVACKYTEGQATSMATFNNVMLVESEMANRFFAPAVQNGVYITALPNMKEVRAALGISVRKMKDGNNDTCNVVFEKEGHNCTCVNVRFGEYTNQIWVHAPEHMPKGNGYCLDRCIAEEVMALWMLGITTTGSCCGHGTDLAFIGVADSDVEYMKRWGYENIDNGDMEHSFKPKGAAFAQELLKSYL